MIIKSNTHRYWPGIFKRLVEYIDSDKGRSSDQSFAIHYNHYAQSIPEVIAAFESNDRLRKQRSNGVCLRHHIMSFAPESALQLSPEILNDLAFRYLTLRDEKGLVFAKPHVAEKHVHLHFLISGNGAGSSRSTRKSRAEFLRIHTELERYQMEKYPELNDSIVKLKERTPTLELADIQEKVLASFGKARDLTEFVKGLEDQDLKPYYYREKIRGFLDEHGQKHRLGKFGVDMKVLERKEELKGIMLNIEESDQELRL